MATLYVEGNVYQILNAITQTFYLATILLGIYPIEVLSLVQKIYAIFSMNCNILKNSLNFKNIKPSKKYDPIYACLRHRNKERKECEKNLRFVCAHP